jgi:AcrR family transcriptional regulator
MGKRYKNTEQIILNAAKNVFVKKGFYGTRMHEIAELAKINKAMLHYYFRNKEELYERVFWDLFKAHFFGIYEDFKTDKELKEVLQNYVYNLIECMAEHPDEVSFVIHEYNREPKRFMKNLDKMVDTTPFDLIKYLERQSERGLVKKMDYRIVEMHLLAIAAYPVMTKRIYKDLFGFKKESEYKTFLKNRKEVVYEQLLHWLEVS